MVTHMNIYSTLGKNKYLIIINHFLNKYCYMGFNKDTQNLENDSSTHKSLQMNKKSLRFMHIP